MKRPTSNFDGFSCIRVDPGPMSSARSSLCAMSGSGSNGTSAPRGASGSGSASSPSTSTPLSRVSFVLLVFSVSTDSGGASHSRHEASMLCTGNPSALIAGGLQDLPRPRSNELCTILSVSGDLVWVQWDFGPKGCFNLRQRFFLSLCLKFLFVFFCQMFCWWSDWGPA